MFSVVVQAGGKSSRMGQDKALMPFLGRPLIERVLHRVSGLGDEVLVITNHPDRYRFLDLPLYTDVIPHRGALGGLYTALSVASCPLVGLVACDLPFVSPGLLIHMKEILRNSEADAVLPSTDRGLEPMQAVYRRATCLPLVEQAIQNDQWRMVAWHAQGRVRVLSPEETRELAPHPRTFWNVNTPEEFASAERTARALKQTSGE